MCPLKLRFHFLFYDADVYFLRRLFVFTFILVPIFDKMAATGVTVADAAVATFTEFKKQSHTGRFIIFKIEGPQIVVEAESEDANFDNFTALLPENECRYALYKMDFTTNDGRPGTKLANISWLLSYLILNG